MSASSGSDVATQRVYRQVQVDEAIPGVFQQVQVVMELLFPGVFQQFLIVKELLQESIIKSR